MKRLYIICFFLLFIIENAYNQDTIKNILEFKTPEFNGIIKTKIEYDIKDNLYRFTVRNARFAIKDEINEYFGYKMEIDLSDEGKIVMLDAYVKFIPLSNLEISLGQRKIPFGTDYLRNPAENFFANRSFVAKYVNNGLRDIGAVLSYKFKVILPIEFYIAALNGTGNNNPEWVKVPDFAGRILLGNNVGFRLGANVFSGEKELEKNLFMYGGEIRFATKKFLIETEIINRQWKDTLFTPFRENGFYIHSYYNFTINKKAVKTISPVARWDLMGENIFKNNMLANRLTIGLNFGFEKKTFYSEIRFNYEKYFKAYLPVHTDKLTIEFLARF
jgi:hypothetical protein